MVLEYLVGRKYEKLNLMEVEDYQEVCFTLAINCWFQISIYDEILVFILSDLSYLQRGMHGLNALRGLKTQDCSKSR